MKDEDAGGLLYRHLGWGRGQSCRMTIQQDQPEKRLFSKPGLGLMNWEAR